MLRVHRTLELAPTGWLVPALLALLSIALTMGCASGRAFQQGNQAAMRGDWDLAVTFYRNATRNQPDRPDYRMALGRAQLAASQLHFDRARDLERKDQLDLALLEYRRVLEYHPSNLEARSKVQNIEQTIRDRIEASRPRPAIEAMREKARQLTAEPILIPLTRDPVEIKYLNQKLSDILNLLAAATGINITYDSAAAVDRAYTVDLKGVTLEQALQQILSANGLFYKVLNERSIIVIPENPLKRQSYDEQALKTFYLSNADPTDILALLNGVLRITGGVQPAFIPNKSNNSITVRASVPMLQIIERVIEANDKPRAELVIDVEIMEVNRNRAKQYGLDLGSYAVGMTFSPESRPGGTTTGGTGTTPSSGDFNLNTISAGISTADFYMGVPQATVRFLEQDAETKVVAKPQLRGSEGETLKLNLGEELPVPSTTFYSPFGATGVATAPTTSFQYKNVGVNLEIEPRVTYDGDIIMKLKVEVSAQGADKNVAGQNLPAFFSRKVESRLRLRDGESNLLAGLLREDERRSLKGLPGVIHVPVLRDLFSANDRQIQQTDIVMLLTPHIVRTHELTQRDLSPIYIGTQQNLGLTGPPPLITPPDEAAAPATATQPPSPAGQSPIGGGALSPGTVPATGAPAAIVPVPGTLPPPAQPAIGSPLPVPPPQAAAPTPVAPPLPVPSAPAAQVGVAPVPPTVPATVFAPPVGTPVPPRAAQTPPAAAPAPVAAAAAGAAAIAGAGVPLKVTIGVPSDSMMVAGGPYMMPIAVEGASRLSTISVSLSFNPRVLKARLVQEGSFMRKDGRLVTFSQVVDAASGRVDITVTRTSDTIGATGAGMVAAVIFDAIGGGASPLALSGVATVVGGAPVQVQFVPASVTVR